MDMAADMDMTNTPLPTSAETTSPPDRFYAPPATPDSRKIGGIIVGAVLGFASLAIGVYLLFKWTKARHRRPGTRRTGKKRANSDNARNGTLPQGRQVKNGPELPLHQLDGTYERPPRCPPARCLSTEALRDMYFTETGSLSQWQIRTRRSEDCPFEDTYAQKSRCDTDELPHATIGNSSSGRFAPSQDHHGNFTATTSDIAHAASSHKFMGRLNSAKALPPTPVSEDFSTGFGS